MTTTYEGKTGPELVSLFNKMANSAEGQELGMRPVTKFQTIDVGVQRCQKAESSIKAFRSGQAEAEADIVPSRLVQSDETIATPAKAKKAKEPSVEIVGLAERLGIKRAGTFLHRLVAELEKNLDSQMAMISLCEAVYEVKIDPTDKKSILNFEGKLLNVRKGVDYHISKQGLKYVTKVEKDQEGNPSLGLHSQG